MCKADLKSQPCVCVCVCVSHRVPVPSVFVMVILHSILLNLSIVFFSSFFSAIVNDLPSHIGISSSDEEAGAVQVRSVLTWSRCK